MKLIINAVAEEVLLNISITTLLEQRDIAANSVAVVVNGVITPRSSWSTTICQANDEIEIFSAVAGG
ncbi:sulfur carrier protein ThiS [Shewanella mangrovi]|nr:sulfur carrier protein ThiS [Shewanella mangrovi]